ncbi:hypothetical protein CF394_15330 [Tetzosporium hominis]|uniref:YCII-related domain-containing protein n=1 Tax=Tetzosporium hominis TaxID=2020506 RepID=A0A264VZF1_9BACL|nr:YciI family protein [Tetzosporium hominis]OZS76701.1 hypothetical protein CF394_15330 [Tetzosporium hominis]
MIFVCMGYFDKDKMHQLPSEEFETLMAACQPHMEALKMTGNVLVDAGLDSEVTSLKRREGKVYVTDGLEAASSELIGSVFLIEADTLQQAIELAALHPTTQLDEAEKFGWRTEIRPVHTFTSSL